MMSFMDTHAADLFANRPPYLKEGVVMRKHLLESANQKAKHREWRECLLVVGQGELKMYGLQSDTHDSSARKNMIRASSASFANLADSLTKNYASNNSTTFSPTSSFGGASQIGNNRWTVSSILKNENCLFILLFIFIPVGLLAIIRFNSAEPFFSQRPPTTRL